MEKKKFKVLFCGTGHFASAYEFTKALLENESSLFQVVECEREQVASELHDTSVIVPLMTRITRKMIDDATNLKMIMQFGVGVEGIDINAATSRGIHVCNIPSEICGNADSCSEMCIYLALALCRNPFAMNESIRSGKLGTPTGKTLLKSTIMIYGFGGMGKCLLERLLPFKIDRIFIVVRNLERFSSLNDASVTSKVQFISETSVSLYSSKVDILFLCCSQNPGNIGMVNSSFIATLKQGCFLVNVARVLIDELQFMYLNVDNCYLGRAIELRRCFKGIRKQSFRWIGNGCLPHGAFPLR